MTERDTERDPLKEEIVSATYGALTDHGYGDLTMQAIADEFEKSKSLLYYHYDGKDDLLADVLEYTVAQFLDEIEVESDDPAVQLRTLIDLILPETLDEEAYEAQIALFELRTESPYERRFHEQYTRADEALKTLVADVLRRGRAEGTFADVDPELEAELLISILVGARTRRLTSYDDFPTDETRRAIETYLDRITSADS